MVAISLLLAVQYARMYVVENCNGYDEVQDCHIVKAFILLQTCRSGCPKFFKSEVAEVQASGEVSIT